MEGKYNGREELGHMSAMTASLNGSNAKIHGVCVCV